MSTILQHIKRGRMVVSGGRSRQRQAARELSPAQQNTVKTIEGRLQQVEKALKDAQAALAKWQESEKFNPQKSNLEQSAKTLRQLGTVVMGLASKL